MPDSTHSGHKSPACGFPIPYEEEVGRERGKRSAWGCAVEEAAWPDTTSERASQLRGAQRQSLSLTQMPPSEWYPRTWHPNPAATKHTLLEATAVNSPPRQRHGEKSSGEKKKAGALSASNHPHYIKVSDSGCPFPRGRSCLAGGSVNTEAPAQTWGKSYFRKGGKNILALIA